MKSEMWQNNPRLDALYENSKTRSLSTYLAKKVVPACCKAVRAEAGAHVGHVPCVVDGLMSTRFSPLGVAVCITCGKLCRWSGCDGGHYIGKPATIALEERGIHPQCKYCNHYLSGAASEYRTYVRAVYGKKVDADIRQKKQIGRTHDRVELVELYARYLDRIKAAVAIIEA